MTGPGLGLEFRDMADADLEDALRLSRASGWNQTLSDWRLLLSLGRGLFRLALQDGRVVASGGAVRYGDALAWICMILVAPDERGHGLGTRIFDEVLDRLRAPMRSGRLLCVGLDATPLGRGLYLKRGFVEGSALVRLRAEPGATSDGAGGASRLGATELEPILERDLDVFGADRASVLRALAASTPELAFVARKAGRLRGYCFGRHGDHADQLGPVVAEDAAVARELVGAVLARPRDRPLVIDARDEPGWLATLVGLGFREQRPLTRMYLGAVRPAARPELEPAILGPEFG